MALLEREGVLAALGDHLARAVGGQGRLILLRGEAGIGKTAVLSTFAELTRPTANVLLGACDPLNTPRPLGPLLDIATGLHTEVRPDLASTLVGPAALAEVFRRVMDALGVGQPKVLVFEDVHWADEATLDLMCLLARRLERTATMLVASYRDDEIGPTHPVRILLGNLAGVPTVHRHTIEPLSQYAVAQLANGRRIDVAELFRVTGGNPFLVSEVLAFGGTGIPPAVAEAVEGRLCRVSRCARAAAELIAVFDAPAPVELVGALVEDMGVIEELLSAGLLKEVGDAVGFRHELARMAMLDMIPTFRRTALHARVLDRLRDDSRRRHDSALLAHHAEQAGDREAVLAHAPVAAEHAAALGAHQEAATHYERAIRFGNSLPADRRATLLERLGRERFMGCQLNESVIATEAAFALRSALGDRLRQGDDLRWLSFVLWSLGRSAESKEVGTRALQVLEALPQGVELAWAYANMCQLSAYNQDGVAVARDYAERAVVLGERFGNAEIVGQARFHLAATRYLCAEETAGDSWSEMDSARVATREAGLVEPAVFMAMLTGLFTTLHRDIGRGFAALDLVEEYSLDHDIPTYLLVSRGTRAYGMVHSGDWVRAAELAEAVLCHPRPPPIARILPLTALALIRARRSAREVWPLLDEALGLAEPTGWTIGPARVARAEAAWLAGDRERSLAEAKEGLAVVTPHTDPWVTGELARWVRFAGGEVPAVPSVPAFVLELAGDWQAAARMWSGLGCAYDAALSQLDGDVSALVQALHTFQSLGARAAADVAHARLREQGARIGRRGPRPATQAHPYGLTSRQHEVLELLRDNLTGAQIAAQLHISRKTVDHHVTAILTKLGVCSRADAVSKLGRGLSGSA